MVAQSMTRQNKAVDGLAQTRRRHERELVERLRGGDASAYETLVRGYAELLYQVARRFLRCDQDCADAVQEAFIAAFQTLGSFKGRSSLGTWLHRIVINCCLMKLRTRRRRPAISIEELLPRFDENGRHLHDYRLWPSQSPEERPSVELSVQVRACLEALPEPYRVVILLRDIEELDTEEAAEILGVSSANVKTRLHRARQALRTLLEETMPDTHPSRTTTLRSA